MCDVRLSAVRLTKASATDARSGLVGFVTFQLSGTLRIDNVALRRTTDGRHALSLPARRDSKGGQHPYLRLNDADWRQVEREVLAALYGEGAA